MEPFAGAAGYATRYHDRRVILVEKDPRIAALWRFLIGASTADIESIPLLLPGQTTDDLVGVPPEARDLVGFWINKGAAQPRKSPSTWMATHSTPLSWWGTRVRSCLAGQAQKIKHWRIIEGSYETAPELRATWYVDPPYQSAGRLYRFPSSQIDFASLGTWCQHRDGQVIVCENVGATWLPFRHFADIQSNQGRRGKMRSAEAIWTQDN